MDSLEVPLLEELLLEELRLKELRLEELTASGVKRNLRAFKVIAVGCLALGLMLASGGCYSASQRGKSRAQGSNVVENKDYARRGRDFEQAAALATRPEDKTQGYVEAGRAYLEGGDPEKALQLFGQARLTPAKRSQARRIDQGLGEAYFELGEFYLASRYLDRYLEGGGVPKRVSRTRERVLAKLVVCHRALEDAPQAVGYRKRLARPFTYEVNEILSMDPVRNVSGKRRHVGSYRPGVRPDRVDVSKRTGASRQGETGARQPSGRGRVVAHRRKAWGARRILPSRAVPMRTPSKITVHHTADVFWSRHEPDTTAEIRRIQRLHQTNNRWADIGYHYVIDRAGQLWQGRDLRYQGAHAGGAANVGNVGIVLLGNYVKQKVNIAQRRTLALLVGKLCAFYRIPPDGVYTHGEIHGKTDCPGPALARHVRQLRAQMRRKLVAYRP